MPLHLLSKESNEVIFDATKTKEDCLDWVYSNYPSINQSVLSRDPPLVLDKPDVLFVFQHEAAVIDLAQCQKYSHIGSDDATTCHIVYLVCNSMENGGVLMAVAHLDNGCVQECVNQLIKAFPDNAALDVYLFGGYDDDVSRKLSLHILGVFMRNEQKCILRCAVITKLNSVLKNGCPGPINTGIAYDVVKKEFHSASFKCREPDSAIREVQVMYGGSELHFVYDRLKDLVIVEPFYYEIPSYAKFISTAPDHVILKHLSTSPTCEPPHFCDHMRGVQRFMLENPDPLVIFENQARCWKFESGGWKCVSGHRVV